ncbi:MAG: hypothetical protein J7449_01215 [Thermomicrobium sp.]|jgi:mono/diheme cytochrome c family protein|nr:hypothetical protein [Thermomicrobium sp.]MBO9350081.1 hypothetical protein [Thermomicrobium sp.]
MAQPQTLRRVQRSTRGKRIALVVGGTLLTLFLALQGVALALPRTNPPVVAEPAWDSPQTRELFMRACGDCHSNQTN